MGQTAKERNNFGVIIVKNHTIPKMIVGRSMVNQLIMYQGV